MHLGLKDLLEICVYKLETGAQNCAELVVQTYARGVYIGAKWARLPQKGVSHLGLA